MLLFVAVVGHLVHDAITERSRPPDIRIESWSTHPGSDGYTVTVRLVNQGGETAADVEVEGELVGADGRREISTATIPYLPGGSAREAGLIFTLDPRESRLTVRPKGYRKP